jgi:hypothetical protein
MDYEDDESEYADDYPDRDTDYPDRDTIEEPRHSFTQEVRDLFHVSLVTDLVVEHQSDDCRDSRRCSCPTTSYYYLGHRAVPKEGIEKVRITPTFQGLAFLEEYCEQNIRVLRAQANNRTPQIFTR